MDIIICNNNENQINRLEKICRIYCTKQDNVMPYISSKTLYNILITQHPKTDLFIIDTNLSEISGIQLKDLICDIYASTSIIFWSEDTKLMPDAFGRHVLAFLHKHRDEDQLISFLQKLHLEHSKTDSLTIADGKKSYILSKSHIVMIHAEHVYSNVTLLNYINAPENINEYSNAVFRISLNTLENILHDNSFLRVGRDCIINLAFVREISNKISLINGQSVDIPVRKLHYVKEKYHLYRSENAQYISNITL